VLRIDPVVSWIAALAMALLFASAVLHKLRDWPRFRGIVADYRVVPASLTTPAAAAVVLLEIAVVALLLGPGSRPAGGLAAGCLLIGYAVCIALNLHRGRTTLDCGCVAAGRRSRIHRGMVVRNLLLAASMLLVVVTPAHRNLTALDGLTVAAVTIVVALLYLASDTLASVTALRAEAS
jgi:uncharacterized membrane protein YphA (DoxX/SURF4 family)